MIEDIESDQPICYEPDCNEPGGFYTYPEEDLDVETVDFHVTYAYCVKHAVENGFCCCCGMFAGGLDEFMFPAESYLRGLCPSCQDEMVSELKAEFGSFDDDPYQFEDWVL